MRYRQTLSSIVMTILIFSVCLGVSLCGVLFFHSDEAAAPLSTLVVGTSGRDGNLKISYGYIQAASSSVEIHEITVAGKVEGEWQDFFFADTLHVDRSLPGLADAFITGHSTLGVTLGPAQATLTPQLVTLVMNVLGTPQTTQSLPSSHLHVPVSEEGSEVQTVFHPAGLFSSLSPAALISTVQTNTFILNLVDFSAVYSDTSFSAGVTSLNARALLEPSLVLKEMTIESLDMFVADTRSAETALRLDMNSFSAGIVPDGTQDVWTLYLGSGNPLLTLPEAQLSARYLESSFTIPSQSADILSFVEKAAAVLLKEYEDGQTLLAGGNLSGASRQEEDWTVSAAFRDGELFLKRQTMPSSLYLSEGRMNASRSGDTLNIEVSGKGSMDGPSESRLTIELPGTAAVSAEEFRIGATVPRAGKITVEGELGRTGVSLASSAYDELSGVLGMDVAPFIAQNGKLHFDETSVHATGTSLEDVSVIILTDITVGTEETGNPLLAGTISLSYEAQAPGQQALDVRLSSFESSLLPGILDASLVLDISDVRTQGDLMLSSTAGFFGKVGYNDEDGERAMSANFDVKDFALVQSRDMFYRLIPATEGLINDDTSLVGSLRVDAVFPEDSWQPGSGNLMYEMAVVDIGVGSRTMNIASTAVVSLGDGIFTVDSFSLTTEGYRLSFSGWVPFDRRAVPIGRFSFQDTTQGEELANVTIDVLGSDGYTLEFLFPQIPELSIHGDVDLAGIGTLVGSGVLTAWEQDYPTDLFLDYRNLNARLSSAGLGMVVSLSGGELFLGLDFSDLAVPSFGRTELSARTLTVNGKVTFILPLDDFSWSFTADSLMLDNIPTAQGYGAFSTTLAATPSSVRFSDVSWNDGLNEPVSGYAALKLSQDFTRLSPEIIDGLEFIVSLDVPSGNESFAISVAGKQNSSGSPVLEGLIQADGIITERFSTSFPGALLELNALGSYVVGSEGTDIDGFIRLYDAGPALEDNAVSGVIKLDDTGLFVSDVTYAAEGMSILLEAINIMPEEGRALVEGSMEFIRETEDKPWVSSFGFSGGIQFDPLSSPVQALLDFSRSGNIPLDWMTGMLRIEDAVLFSDEMLGTIDLSLSYNDGSFLIEGADLSADSAFSQIHGSYSLDDAALDVQIVPGTYPLGLRMKGRLGQEISLEIDEISVPLRLLTYLMDAPILVFHDGIATGKLLIYGPKDNVEVFGQISADRLDMTSFWTPRTKVSAKNPVVILSEGMLTSGKVPVIFTDTITGETAEGYTVFEADLAFIDYSILMGAGNIALPVSFPVPNLGLVISGSIRGDLTFSGIPNGIGISGSGFISDTAVDFELPDDLPEWYQRPSRTNLDLDLTTERNVAFSFPSAENPILEANIQPGQNIVIHLDEIVGDFSLSGSVDIRSGTIYYFRKDFYITEGSLSFPEGQFRNGMEFSPVINLRAKIREYDSDGNAVDVFLVLDNASLDNLNPRFESVPSKSAAEILQLLGENFLGATGTGDATVSSVASLAVAATDVISRMGLVNTGTSFGLSRSIKQSLGLDMFSIRSNIVQNVFFEALPGYEVSSVASPLARYLDDTSLFFGKFLTDDLFLQGTVHLTAQSQHGADVLQRIRFINDDLWVDTELSLEWTTPLATFTIFTQPTELSIFGISDTIGISVTKRLAW